MRIVPQEVKDTFRRAGYRLERESGQRYRASPIDPSRRGNHFHVWLQFRNVRDIGQYKAGGRDYKHMSDWLSKGIERSAFLRVNIDPANGECDSNWVALHSCNDAYRSKAVKGYDALFSNIINGDPLKKQLTLIEDKRMKQSARA